MNYRWWINNTTVVTVSRNIADRDIPPSVDELQAIGVNAHEVVTMERRIESPMVKVPAHMSATGNPYVSKANRNTLLEMSAIEQEAYNLPVEQRGEHSREISKIMEMDK